MHMRVVNNTDIVVVYVCYRSVCFIMANRSGLFPRYTATIYRLTKSKTYYYYIKWRNSCRLTYCLLTIVIAK